MNIKYKISLLTAGGVILASLLCYYIFFISLTEIDKDQNNILFQKTEAEKKYIEIRNRMKMSEKLKTISPQIEKINKIFINKNQQLEFITTLEGIANNDNVNQIINMPTQPKFTDNYATMSLQLVVRGSYNNLYKYLTDLENLNFYINIDSMDISGNGDDVNMNLSAEIYLK